MNQKGSVWIFILMAALVTLVIGGGIYWAQTINKEIPTIKPELHLQQISDPEKFVNPTVTDATGLFCGGFAGVSCPTGYTCKRDGDYPDASGKCTKAN